MNKLFSYSKNAAFIVIFLLLAQIALTFVEGKYFMYIRNLVGIIFCILWIVLFALIAKKSVKNSPLITPSYIIIVGYVFSIIGIIISVMVHWYLGAAIMNVIAMVATVIGFIWLSKFFAKGSLQKVASIIIPIVIAADFIVSTFLYKPWTIEDESKRILAMHIRSIIDYVATYGSAFFFMFSLSKLKK